MRLLFVSHSFPAPGRPLSNVGGMQRVAVDLHRALQANPELELHSLVLETSWRWTGVRTPPFLLRVLASLPRIVAEKRIDVVLFSSMVTASVVPMMRRRLHQAGAITAAIPVGRDVTLPNPAYQRLVPHVLESLDLVLPISRATAAECIARGADPADVHVVPCGTNFDQLPEERERGDAREAVLRLLGSRGLKVNRESLLLLSVGRQQERKGFHWFVDEVMPGTSDDTVYILAGSGPMAPRIQEVIDRRGLADRVVMLGQVSEETLASLYSGADLFIMPNIPVAGDIEGFGVVMVEAGAAGQPVVAADLEGIRDVIEEGRNGRLIPSRDATAFAAAIEAYRDRDVLAAAASRAREHVRSRFAWPVIADQMIQLVLHRLARSPQEPATTTESG